MIRVKYNSNTGQVLGNYPSSINYPSITIDEENKTITDSSGTFPYIEITKEQHEANMGKVMVVVDGDYQEYVKTDDELLQEAKDAKKAEIKAARDAANIANHTRTGGRELIIDNNGNITGEGNLVTFIFDCKPILNNPAANPAKLLEFARSKNIDIPYSCEIQDSDEEGNIVFRSGVVKIDSILADAIENHIANRNSVNYLKYGKLKESVNNATTISEVNLINW
jgi:hypothetical protein